MNEDLKYQEYLSNGGALPYEEYVSAATLFSQIESVDEDLKKKDQPTENGNPSLTTGIPPSQTDLPTLTNPIPENEFMVPLGSEQDLSLESAITEQPTSTELPLTPTVSSGVENSNVNLPIVTEPALTNVGITTLPQKPITASFNNHNPNPFARDINSTFQIGGMNLPTSTLDVLAGKSNNIQGDITLTPSSQAELDADTTKNNFEANQNRIDADKADKDYIDQFANKDYVNAESKIKQQPFNVFGKAESDEAVDNLLLLEDKGLVQINRDTEGNPILEDNSYIYKITDKKFYDEEYVPSIKKAQDEYKLQAQEQNIDSASFNNRNVNNNPKQDDFSEFVSKVNKLGGDLITTDDYQNITTYEARQEYLATTEATQNAQKNGTTFQEEYDKVIPKYSLTEEVKIQNGFEALNLLNGGLESGNTKDKSESDFFTDYFADKSNVMQFGEYWNNEGKAKYQSSQVMENQANYQAHRAKIWNDYLSYQNDKLGTDMRFIEEAVVNASALADKYTLSGDVISAQREIAKVENLSAQYDNNEAGRIAISNLYSESNKNFKELQKQKQQEANLQIKVENGDVLSNVGNMLGQIPLGIATSVNSTISGAGRILSSVIPSDNLKDALDIMSNTDLKVGNVKVASLSNKVVDFVGNDGFKYREINGTTYGVKSDGNLFATQYNRGQGDKVVKESVDYNWGSGLAFVTSKMMTDIVLTSAVGGGINKGIASASSRIANSKNIATVFGEGSQLAKSAESFARLAKNADNVSVSGWYVQMYNDSYLMAERGGIKGELNKSLYAITQSFMQSVIQRINPDINFLKSMNDESRQIVRALMTNEKDKAVQLISAFVKKTGNNVLKETGEEVIQQVTQDLNNLVINKIGKTNLETTDSQGYKEVVFGTVIPSAIASLMGGKGSRIANINNKEINLTTYSRNDLVTELARDKNGADLIKDFRNTAYFQSQKDFAQDIANEITERQKYISKVPEVDKYSTPALSEVAPILQQIDKKKEDLKKDDGTFAERINKDIAELTTQANAILDNDLTQNNESPNAETAQPTPQSEAVQEQTPETEQPQVATESEQPTVTGEQNVPSELNNTQDGQTTVQEQGGSSQAQENVQPSNQAGQDATNQLPEMGEGIAQSENATQEVAPQEEINEDDIVLADDTLDLINSLTDETAPSDNPTTDGNVEPAISSVQQGGQENNVQTPTEPTTSQGTAEVSKNLNAFKKGDRVYNSFRDKVYEVIDDSKPVWKLRDEDGKISELNADNNGGFSLSGDVVKAVTENNTQPITTPDGKSFYQKEDGNWYGTNAKGGESKVTRKNRITELDNLNKEKNVILTKEKNGFTYKKYKDGSEEIVSSKGKIITSKIERRRNGKLRIENNPQFTTQRAKIFGEITDNQIKIQERKRTNEALKNFIPTSERDLALLYFANGGKISPESVKREIAGSSTSLENRGKKRSISEYTWVWLGEDAVNTFEQASEKITADEIQEFDQPTLRNELIDIAKSYGSRAEIAEEITDRYNSSVDPYFGFTEEDAVAMQEAELNNEQLNLLNSVEDNNTDISDEELLDYYKNQYENSIQNLTKEQQDEIYKPTNSERNAQQSNQTSGNEVSNSKIQTSPEYKNLIEQRDSAEKEVSNKKAKLDSVSKSTNQNFQADQENLFGDRATTDGNALFDERANGNAGQEVIAQAKSEYDQAKAELSRLNNSIRDFESGKVKGTESIDFQSTDKQFTPITQKAYNALVKKLSGVFKKFGANVVSDLSEFKAKAKALGFSDSDVDFMISRSRLSVPKVRGGWTKDKIIKYLKSNGSDTAGKLGVLEAIASYDTFEDFKNNIYYHGTTNFISKGLKPSITMSEAEAERNGGGGYGERYYGVSLTKRKRTAESFSGQNSSVTIYPVLLKKDANVIVREDLEDANEVEDIVVELYEQGVDAVWIGGGEQELVVINPKASMLYKNGRESFQVYGGFKSTQPTDADLKKTYERAKKEYKEKSAELRTKNGKEEREAFLNSIDNVQFMKTANGEIYGAKLPDGTIYLNPDKVNANTPIHEFSHLWQQLMPSRFKSGVEILKSTPIGKKTFAELKSNEGYANKTDEEIWNEALVTVMGNEGERIFNSPKTSKIKTWLTDFFKKLGDVLGIRKLTPTDNLSVFVKGALSEVMGDKEIFAEGATNVNNNIDFSFLSAEDFDADGNVKPEVLAQIDAERKSIVEKAKADGTYLKAPNGNDTNLNEEQWVNVRTDRFKNWFGDWEAEAILNQISNPNTANEFINNLLPTKDNSVLRLPLVQRLMLASAHNDKIFGGIIGLIPVNVMNNIVGHNISPDKIRSNPSVFINAINSPISNENILSLEKTVAIFTTKLRGFLNGGSNEISFATLNAEDFGLQIIGGLSAFEGFSNFRGSNGYIELGSTISTTKPLVSKGFGDKSGFAKFTNLFNEYLFSSHNKSFDKDNKTLSVSQVIDDNGEPLVVYHGTDKEFEDFNIGYAEGWGYGSYFTDNKQQAIDEFGEKYKSVFLNVKNNVDGSSIPYNEIATTKEFDNLAKKKWDKLQEWEKDDFAFSFEKYKETGFTTFDLINMDSDANSEATDVINAGVRELGYDGIITQNSNNIDGKEIVVFSPNQIKSATSNAGTYSNKTGRIDFQIPTPQKPKNLMPKSLIANIADTIRNGGKGAEVMNIVNNSNWFKGLGESAKANLTFNDVKSTLIDSDNFHRENDKVKAKERMDKSKAEAEAEKAKRDAKLAEANPLKADDKIIYTNDKPRNKFIAWKEKWFSNEGGILKPVMNFQDKATGKTNMEIRFAKDLIARLSSEAKKANFYTEADWANFDTALRGDKGSVEAYNELPDAIKPFVNEMRMKIDGLSEFLVENDLVTPSQAVTIDENKGQYVSRAYKFF